MSEPTICINYATGKLSYGLHTHCPIKGSSGKIPEYFYSNFDAIIHKPLLCYPPVVSIYIEEPNYFSLSFFCFQDLEKLPTVPTYIVDEFR